MDFFATSAAPVRQRTDCAIVGIYKAKRLSADAQKLDKASGGRIAAALASGDIDGAAGSTLMLRHVPRLSAKRVLLVGLGTKRGLGLRQYRQACAAAATVLRETGARDAVSYLSREPLADARIHELVRQGAKAIADGFYRFDELKSKPPRKYRLRRLGFAGTDGDLDDMRAAITEAEAINEGIALARTLGNRPPNVCTPTHLAEQGRALAKEFKSVTTKTLGRAEMKKMKMGAFLSVTAGAHAEPKLIVMQHKGGPGDAAPIVLIGKGITFDSGGISLKPPPAMDEMKFDMCGAASVLGVMHSVARLELPLNVVGIVPACENMPSGTATHPGDIVETMSGQTVEILNTDAEGRLILCDALTYSREFGPDTVIDIATLTGACVIALGGHHSGLMTGDDDLAEELLAAGRVTADVAWRLPLTPEYAEELESNFADFANVGGKPGGAITAACFLQKFAGKLRWAHLDIAGSAWRPGKEKGATGRPVGLLVQYLINRASADA